MRQKLGPTTRLATTTTERRRGGALPELSRVAPEQQPRTDRAERLRDLETQPPKWLVKAVGRPPGKSGNLGALLAWRRAALALDDYRREHAPELASDGLVSPPSDERAARAYAKTS